MHKKLFTAVLALGLLLAPFVIASAAAPDDVYQRPVITGSGPSRSAPAPSLSNNPVTSVFAGSNRTVPGTFCDGDYTGGYTGYFFGGWFEGFEPSVLTAYQDIDNLGSCAPGSNYTFDVTAVNAILVSNGSGSTDAYFQPVIWEADLTNPACPIPGSVLHAGPVYAYTLAEGSGYLINLPFAIEACVTGPYFAGFVAYDPLGTSDYGAFGPGLDYTRGAPVQGCYQYANDFYGTMGESGWYNVTNLANMMVWSEGYTPDDIATHCTPGTCTYEVHYTCSVTPAENTGPCVGNPGAGGTGFRYADGNDDWDAAFGLPSGQFGGRTKLGTRFDAIGLDTLKEVQFLIYDAFDPGPEDLLIEIWDGSGPLSCGAPTPGALLFSTTILGNVVSYPLPLIVPIPDITWGTLNGGPTASIFATIECLGSGATTTAVTAGDPETALGCPATSWSVAYYPASTEYGGAAVWKSMAERAAAGSAYQELYVDALICREVLPAIEANCGSGSDEDWPNFAHDNRQTSASSINVGDPNGVTSKWQISFLANSNFTSPTVANDIVYMSSDNTVNAVDLATGVVIGTASGGPEMAASGNRGNTTVAFTRGVVSGPDRDLVFATGSTFNSVSAWEYNLETSGPAPIWSRNGGSPPSLAQQNRFNTCKVVDVAGTDVLFISTEPNLGTGRIWALVAGTGALYPGWATNPVILDAAAKHGPAVSGGKLYVGTAIGGSNLSGSLYQIDAATGVVDWNFVGVPGEGWPSGVSVEGDFIYAATRDAVPGGYRYKIDKSGAPTIVWTAGQGVGLYGTPTIGRGFVYFPLDNPNFGLLQVDKNIGTVARNYAASAICTASPFMIPQIVTLSCDAYLFAGDRNGRWWLFNAVTGDAEWYRQFPSTVMGTALASASNGDDYAVVAAQTDGVGGILSAYKLNSGSRPRLIQCLEDVTIEVPFGTLAGNPHSEADVLLNIGDLPLNITAFNVSDPTPDGAAASARQRESALSTIKTGLRYMNADGYYDAQGNEKALTMAGLLGAGGEEWNGATLVPSAKASSRNSSRMAASASAIRTSVVTVSGAMPAVIAPGGSASVDWLFDGTLLNRGIDLNVIELTNDDPDFDYDAINNGSISVAELYVLYVGGCAQDQTWIQWNLDGANPNAAKVFNHGTFCDQGVDAMIIGDDATSAGDDQRWEGGVLLTGDSSAAIGGSQLAIDYYFFEQYIPNPNPAGDCGFEKDSGLVLGAKRTGGCPGLPEAITGAYVKTYYADSNLNVAFDDPLASMGINVEETEVGADDPLYGDFILSRMLFVNRDATAKTVRGGTYFDWDINVNSSGNVGYISDGFNGYAIWDPITPRFAYGVLDANQPSSYGGADPTAFPPALIMCNLNDTTYTGVGGGGWTGDTWPQDWDWGWFLANGKYAGPRYSMGGNGVAGIQDDRGGFLMNEMNIAANSTGEVVQVQFAFDIAGNSNDAFVEASGQDIAERASRWAGFARGDVNDDGLVDLADVCWLQGGNPIYPDLYCGDVNNDGLNDGVDIAQLLSFVSGNAGAQPVGAWRFPW